MGSGQENEFVAVQQRSAEGLEVVCLDEFECVLQFLWIRVAAEAELKRGGDLVGGLWPEFPLQALGEQF